MERHRNPSNVDWNRVLIVDDEPASMVPAPEVQPHAPEVQPRMTDNLARLAHDLCSGLMAISGTSAVLHRIAQDITSADRERALESLARIDSSVAQMQRLLKAMQDTLDPVQQGVGGQQYPTDVVEITQRMVTEYEHLAYPQRLHFATTAASLPGRWARIHIEHIVRNLLANAIKYSVKPGVITVTAASALEAGLNYAVLTFRDQGVGIPPADLPYVFDHGYRASNVIHEVGGTGRGLASVRRLVEYYGGDISVTSVEDVGSTFTVRLPMSSLDAPGYYSSEPLR